MPQDRTDSRAIFFESFFISLWVCLLLTSWQMLSVLLYLDQYTRSIITWIHFVLYALGGTLLLTILAMIPVIICAFIRSVFRKSLNPAALRRYLLTGLVWALLVIAFFSVDLWSPSGLLASGGLSPRILFRLIMVLIVAGIFAWLLSTGIIQLLESMSARTRWSFLWGILIFVTIFLPVNNFILGVFTGRMAILGFLITFLIAIAVFWILFKYMPRIYSWLTSKGFPGIGLAWLLAIVIFFLTMPLKPPIIHGDPATGENPPIILITIETLRPDALDCYPEGLSLRLGTPNISDIAMFGALFESAYAPSSWTNSSVPSFLAGLPPSALASVTDSGTKLTDGATTLAEILNENGYSTCAIVDNSLLAEGGGNEQGFDIYIEEMSRQTIERRLLFQKLIDRIRLRLPEISSPNTNPYIEHEVIRQARDFISIHSGEKFFLWLHLYSPHHLYYPPREYRERVENELGITVPAIDVVRQEDMKNGWPPGTRERLDGLLGYYAGDVAFTDDLVGEVIASLNENKMYSYMMVVSSDHGEEFYDHDRLEHGRSLYPEVTHVPLLIFYPGRFQPGLRIDTPVSLVDLAPTILDLAGVDAQLDGNPAVFFGNSFAPLLTEDEFTPVPVFIERPLQFDQNIKAVIYNDLLYIGGSEAISRPKLFDLETDPGAYYDIINQRPDDAEFLDGLILEFEDACARIAEQIGSVGREEDLENLRTLGYIN